LTNSSPADVLINGTAQTIQQNRFAGAIVHSNLMVVGLEIYDIVMKVPMKKKVAISAPDDDIQVNKFSCSEKMVV
jgi:hypothetical protein